MATKKFYWKAISTRRGTLAYEGEKMVPLNEKDKPEFKKLTQHVKSELAKQAHNGQCQEGELFQVHVFEDVHMIKRIDMWRITAADKPIPKKKTTTGKNKSKTSSAVSKVKKAAGKA